MVLKLWIMETGGRVQWANAHSRCIINCSIVTDASDYHRSTFLNTSPQFTIDEVFKAPTPPFILPILFLLSLNLPAAFQDTALSTCWALQSG